MDFGDVLDEWERIKRERKDGQTSTKAKPRPSALETWLAVHGIRDKDAELGDEAAPSSRASVEARRLGELKPQASLDLHGMTAQEAATAIDAFIEDSSRSGLEKVLVIHGKGLHSAGAPVLKKAARRALEAHPSAGRIGEAGRAEGGSGALWVMIRKKG